MTPYIGQTVAVSLTQEDCNEIESQRLLYAQLDTGHLHQGRELLTDRVYAGIVAAVHIQASQVDIRLLLPGTETPWLKNVPYHHVFDPTPPRAILSPAHEIDRLWPEIRSRIRTLINSGAVKTMPSAASTLTMTD